MDHQTAIITLLRGLASLIIAVQVLGVNFERTFIARWIGSDGGVHVEARTWETVENTTGNKRARQNSIDDVMRLAKKIGGDRVQNGVRDEVERVWKIVREHRDGLILYAQTFDDGNIKELIHDMKIGLSSSEVKMDSITTDDEEEDGNEKKEEDDAGLLFRAAQRCSTKDTTIESLKDKFQERLLDVVKMTGRNITIPFGFVAGKILREKCTAWGFGETQKDAMNGNGGCVMRVAVLPTRDKTHRMRYRQVKEDELMSAMDLLNMRGKRKSI